MSKSDPKNSIVSSALILSFDKILLQHRMDGYWCNVGGKVEEDECPIQACIREIKEETNLDIIEQDLILKDVRKFNSVTGKCRIFVTYLIKLYNKINNIKNLDRKCQKLEFVPIKSLLQKKIGPIAPYLDFILTKDTYRNLLNM